jgi:hypothetical protein
VIDALAGDFEPESLESKYRRDLHAHARRPSWRRGDREAGAGHRDAVIDLMEALRASVAQAGKKKEPAGGEDRPRKAAAARKGRRRFEETLDARRRLVLLGERPSACSCAANSVLSIFPW